MSLELTPESAVKIQNLSDLCINNGSIDPSLYTKYNVKRGLRDLQGLCKLNMKK